MIVISVCTISPRIKRPEQETGHLYGDDTWSFASICPYLHLAWCPSISVDVPFFFVEAPYIYKGIKNKLDSREGLRSVKSIKTFTAAL